MVPRLEPGLAPLLAGLSGLVAETGSPLSHLAILAREQGVPTVVGVPAATVRIRPGVRLLVDRRTGEVREVPTGPGDAAGDDRLPVFIPVLLGAGALSSAAAFLGERIANLLAGVTVDRRTARLLAPDLPLGPLVAPAATDRGPVLRPPRRGGAVPAAAVVVVGGAVATLGLRAVTMARAEPLRVGEVTTIVVEARHRDTVGDPAGSMAALWVACRSQVPRGARLGPVRPLPGDRFELRVEPGIGPVGRRRLTGGPEDARIDRTQAAVLTVGNRPA